MLVEAGAAGVSVTAQTRVDHRNAAIVALDGVEVAVEMSPNGPLIAQSQPFVSHCTTVTDWSLG